MFGIRLFFIGIVATAIAGGGFYVMKLQKDNAILKANAIKLESAVAEQQELITQQKEDFKEILAANQKMNELVGALKKVFLPVAIIGALFSGIKDAFQEFKESGSITGDGETIVIDPIDGTSNFIHGIPHVAIVIGKIVNDQITDGIIYNPILNEFYWASLGKGAWCNNKRIRVSKRQDLVECLIGTGTPFGKRIYPNYYKELEKISKLSAGVRRLGAAALDLAYVSSGKMDGFWEKDLNLWDVSAGVLLIKEAGGRVTEPQGNNWTTKSRDILVSNTLIHEKLLENLTLL